MADVLFPVHNNFHLGAYQAAINAASELRGLTEAQSLERDCFVHRADIELGAADTVLATIPPNAPTSLLAVRLLAAYRSQPAGRASAVATLQSMLGDAMSASNRTLQLVAAQVLFAEGAVPDALRCCAAGAPGGPGSLELLGLAVEMLLSLDRPDVADKVAKAMSALEDDATLTQLAAAAVNAAKGGPKVQEAYYTFQELGEKYAWTVRLMSCSAACAMALGRYDDAERELLAALAKEPRDPSTLANLIVCSLHLGKPTARYATQLKAACPSHPCLARAAQAEAAFDAALAAA